VLLNVSLCESEVRSIRNLSIRRSMVLADTVTYLVLFKMDSRSDLVTRADSWIPIGQVSRDWVTVAVLVIDMFDVVQVSIKYQPK
jgi:hypothetical protein